VEAVSIYDWKCLILFQLRWVAVSSAGDRWAMWHTRPNGWLMWVTSDIPCFTSPRMNSVVWTYPDYSSPTPSGSSFYFLLCGLRWDWVQLVRRPLGGMLYRSRMMYDYGTVGEMRISRVSPSFRRKPAPMPICPPQIPHDLTWDWIRAARMGCRRLTVWAMARSPSGVLFITRVHFRISDFFYVIVSTS
jgi:hypothetical protein